MPDRPIYAPNLSTSFCAEQRQVCPAMGEFISLLRKQASQKASQVQCTHPTWSLDIHEQDVRRSALHRSAMSAGRWRRQVRLETPIWRIVGCLSSVGGVAGKRPLASVGYWPTAALAPTSQMTGERAAAR